MENLTNARIARAASLALLALILPALALPAALLPCGEAEMPFEEQVKRNLLRGGFINPDDVIEALHMRERCGLPSRRLTGGCVCGMHDGAEISASLSGGRT